MPTEAVLNNAVRRTRALNGEDANLVFGTYRIIGEEHGLRAIDFPNDQQTKVSQGLVEAWIRRDRLDQVTLALVCRNAIRSIVNPSCKFYKNLDQFDVEARFNRKLLPQFAQIEKAVDDFVGCLTKE